MNYTKTKKVILLAEFNKLGYLDWNAFKENALKY
jgi:hypothetical protein